MIRLFAALGALVSSLGFAAPLTVATGLAQPESVLHDTANDVYLVANINGSPGARDNNGFISKVSPDGKMVAAHWIEGGRNGELNAPKGMAITGSTLWVADIDTVRRYDLASGKPLQAIKIVGSTFLNDMAAAAYGTVVVSDSGLDAEMKDSGTDAIYQVDAGGKITTLAKGAALKKPNGVAFTAKGELRIVNFFPQGTQVKLDPAGKPVVVTALPTGSLDGIEFVENGNALISSWEAKGVYRVTPQGVATLIAKDLSAPADIGVDHKRKRLLVPNMDTNTLYILQLE